MRRTTITAGIVISRVLKYACGKVGVVSPHTLMKFWRVKPCAMEKMPFRVTSALVRTAS